MLLKFYGSGKESNWAFLALISILLLITRLISFRENSLEPDELEWLYDIRRCLVDPRPFVGFDSHTSGPFAIYILTLLKLLTSFSKLYQLRIISFIFFILPSLFLINKIAQKGTNQIAISVFAIMVSIINIPNPGPIYEAIFSYNSEYQILVLTSILFWIIRNGEGLKYIILYSFILFLLPFIKLQALPLTAFFGLIFVTKIYLKDSIRYVFWLIGAYLFFNICWFIFLLNTNLFDDFLYVYLNKNFEYMASSDFGHTQINPINFFNRFSQFYGFLWIFIGLFFYQLIIKFRDQGLKQFKDIVIHPLTQSSLALLVSILSIILAKNDYGHYYILLFLPASIFVADIYKSLKSHAPIIYIILVVNFNFIFFGYSCMLIWNKVNHISKDDFSFGKPFPSMINPELKNYVVKNKVENSSILILGWDHAQALYYQLQNDFDLTYRSSHCSYYERAFREKNTFMFQKEEQALLEDLNKKMPYFIVDTWDLVSKFKGTAMPEFVAKHYDLKLKRKDFAVFQLKKQ